MDFDPSKIRDVVEGVMMVGGAIITAMIFRFRSEFVGRADFTGLSDRVDAIERGVVGMEARLASTPTHRDLLEMTERIAAIEGEVRAMRHVLEGIGDQIQMLVSHHINGACRE